VTSPRHTQRSDIAIMFICMAVSFSFAAFVRSDDPPPPDPDKLKKMYDCQDSSVENNKECKEYANSFLHPCYPHTTGTCSCCCSVPNCPTCTNNTCPCAKATEQKAFGYCFEPAGGGGHGQPPTCTRCTYIVCAKISGYADTTDCATNTDPCPGVWFQGGGCEPPANP
jgi:hypothetical protein